MAVRRQNHLQGEGKSQLVRYGAGVIDSNPANNSATDTDTL
jgi:hypothetical protein